MLQNVTNISSCRISILDNKIIFKEKMKKIKNKIKNKIKYKFYGEIGAHLSKTIVLFFHSSFF